MQAPRADVRLDGISKRFGEVTAVDDVTLEVAVFQDYALFPHMTVRENVEYGLRVKRRATPAARPGGGSAEARPARRARRAEADPGQACHGQARLTALRAALRVHV
jgi:ABC-type Fe3+/spermidine/putrescine transport system ATPase subunit